jgi:hypothetical protein
MQLLMQSLRKLFGVCFAAVSVISGWSALTTPVMTRYDENVRIGPYLQLGVLVLFAVVPAVAAWTTWRDKAGARVWGVLASFLIGSFLPFMALIRHEALPAAALLVIVPSGWALISFAWPNRQTAIEHGSRK